MKEKIGWLSPLSFIAKYPDKFAFWVLTSIVLSLSSIWIPALVGYTIGEVDWLPKLLESNPFVFFSIIFLSTSILTSFTVVGAGSNNKAVLIRGVTLIITILYLMYLLSMSSIKLLRNISLPWCVQLTILTITILLGIYVYGLRDISWESLGDIVKEQNESIEEKTQKAEKIKITEMDVKL